MKVPRTYILDHRTIVESEIIFNYNLVTKYTSRVIDGLLK